MPGGWLARGQAQALNFTYSRYFIRAYLADFDGNGW
jgi:hypothetical protein